MNSNFKILVRGILAGILISIGGTIYLLCESKMLGAFLFSIGLFTICCYGFNLYTGKIGYIVDKDLSYLKELGLTLIGNLIGTVSCGYLLHLTRSGEKLIEIARSICDVKLSDSLMSIFILSIFCGMIMYLAVDLFKRLKDFGRYVGIFMGITVFILAGFEHCVANMFYFSVANTWSLNTILYVFMMIIGNSVGSIVLALLMKYSLDKNN